MDAALRRAGLEVPASFGLTQAADMLRFAVLGLGVTIVPRALTVTAAPQLAETGTPYTLLALADPLAVHPVTAVFQASRLSVAAREFIDLLERAANHKQKRSDA